MTERSLLEKMRQSPPRLVGSMGILVEVAPNGDACDWVEGDVCVIERAGMSVPLWRNLRTGTTAYLYPSRFTTKGLET